MYFIDLNEDLSTSPLSNTTVIEDFILFIEKPNTEPFLFKKQCRANKENEYDTPFGDFGTYTWNILLSNWEFESTPTDKIIYLFPADAMDELNSSKLAISNIEQLEVESSVILSKIKINLTLDQQEVFGFNYSAIFASNSIEKISLDFNLPPFTLTANQLFEEKSNGVLLTTSFNAKNESITLMSSNLEILLNGDENFSQIDYDSLGDIEIASVDGYIQMGSVKATLDLTPLFLLNESSLPQAELERLANKNLKIKFYVYPSGTSIAYVKWYYNETISDIEPYIVYSDGSEEPAINFVPDIIMEMIEFDDETSEL
jgi:hypothetical protein